MNTTTTRRKQPAEPVSPTTDRERELVKLQRLVSRAAAVLVERNQLLAAMNDDGVTQARLTGLLNYGAIAESDYPMTEDTVQKAIRRTREGR